MDDFVTVFLFAESTNHIAFSIENSKFQGFNILLIGLVGVLFLLFDRLVLQSKRNDNNLFGFVRVKKPLIYILGFLIIFGLILIILIPNSYTIYDSKYLHLLNIYETKQYEIAEGFVDISHTTHRVPSDIIMIDDIKLEVDSYSYSFGYRNGILYDGAYARIFYINSLSNSSSSYTILRVDIKK